MTWLSWRDEPVSPRERQWGVDGEALERLSRDLHANFDVRRQLLQADVHWYRGEALQNMAQWLGECAMGRPASGLARFYLRESIRYAGKEWLARRALRLLPARPDGPNLQATETRDPVVSIVLVDELTDGKEKD
jgi:hypothetical protein